MTPLITIALPVFNDVDFISASLDSILAQTEQNFKLIISDDGSTDGSAEICKAYAGRDKRIKYIRQPKNLGISKNMEFLVAQADTPYFMWAGDDDLIHPDFIKTHTTALENDNNAIVSFNAYAIINEKDKIIAQIDINYGSFSRLIQLFKLVYFENDGFGYGVFKTEKIKHVKFPIWWWPNRKTPYNNIYPSLAYYLNRGRYLHQKKVLFSKRQKSPQKTNHVIGGQGNGTREIITYIIRRFYLVHYTFFQMLKSITFWNAFVVYPFMLIKWFLWSSLKLVCKSFWYKIRKR
ncbi:MAG: glycosyltransferase [Brumimicrobium sp.]|nr:glycosyltransferase [Brumimicrobium sp.]